jgi:hypothetical protein
VVMNSGIYAMDSKNTTIIDFHILIVHGPFLFISFMLQLIISSIFGCTCVQCT